MSVHYTEAFKKIENEMTYHAGSASKHWIDFTLANPYMHKINLTMNLLSGDVDFTDMRGHPIELDDIKLKDRHDD